MNPMADINQFNAVISKRIEIAPGLIILQAKPDGWELPDFKAGQYAVLGLAGASKRTKLSDKEETAPDPDKIIKRPYSISSSSKEKQYIEFYITLIRSGSLTPRLFALDVGDKVFMSEKYKGLFTLKDVPVESNLVLISTGTGLAPYVSMIRTEFEERPNRRFAVLHGARHSWDLGYRAELSTLANYFAGFSYLPTLSRGDEEGAYKGYVQELWTKGFVEKEWGVKPTPQDTHIFLCGAPAMLKDMTQKLEADGFKVHKKKEPGQIHVEKFW